MNQPQQGLEFSTTLPEPHDGLGPCPTVMTQEGLIRCLRILETSSATDYRHVRENLKRKHGWPQVHLFGKTVYLTDSVKTWRRQHVTCGN